MKPKRVKQIEAIERGLSVWRDRDTVPYSVSVHLRSTYNKLNETDKAYIRQVAMKEHKESIFS